MQQSQVSGARSNRKTAVIFAIIVTLAVLIMATLAWVGADKINRLESEKKTLLTENDQLKREVAMSVGAEEAKSLAPKSTFDLIAVYNQLLEQSVNATDAENKAVLAAVNDYYKLQQTPAGATVLVVYQMVKPETPPSGELHALVYWPASEQKPAGFMDVVKAASSTQWKYNEAL